MAPKDALLKLSQLWIFFQILLAILCISCEEKDPIVLCGCTGGKKLEINNDPGIVVNVNDSGKDTFHFLSLHHGYLEFCNSVPPELLVDGQMVRLSGRINIPCKSTDTPELPVPVLPFVMSGYELPADSLFKSNPIIIQIFSSVTTESSGFGYSIETEYGFKVYQNIIPAIGGLQTFSSPIKAFKVAVLVGHKITLNNGLPSVMPAELSYLKVLGD